MPMSRVTRALVIEDRAFAFQAVVWECDYCGRKDAFSDMLDNENRRESERGPQDAGWSVLWTPGFNGDGCACPGCKNTPKKKEDSPC